MDPDRHHQTEVDLEVDLVADDLDQEADPEVVIDDRDHEVEVAEAAAEVEVVADDLEADHNSVRSWSFSQNRVFLRRLFQIGLIIGVIFDLIRVQL